MTFKGMLIAACLLSAPPAWGDAMENLKSIGEKVAEIARQRDEAIASRDYWAVRADLKCRDFKNLVIDEKTDSMIVLQVTGAKPDARFTIVELDSPDRSVCIFKAGEECLLGYDGKRFTSTREFRIKTGGQ